MTTLQKNASSICLSLHKPIAVLLSLYCVSLTLSIAGMEIGAWLTALFCVIYVIFDRLNERPTLKMRLIGVEGPVFLFLLAAFVGLYFNARSQLGFGMGDTRNLALLFFFTLALQISKDVKRLFIIMGVCATLVAVYGIWQHFTGIDLYRGDHRALKQIPWTTEKMFQTVGFFGHHLFYGYSFAMLLCIPASALFLGIRRKPLWQSALLFSSVCIIGLSLVFTYGRGVWISMAASMLVLAFYAGRKHFVIASTILILIVCSAFKMEPTLQQRASSIFEGEYSSNVERMRLWKINSMMFMDHPWFGVGMRQNEPLSATYYEKLGIQNGMAGHAHNNYLEIAATTGTVGFIAYLLIVGFFFVMTMQLLRRIPHEDYWPRCFVLAALGAQVVFHIGGLTQNCFGTKIVQHQFIFWLAIVAYLNQNYPRQTAKA